MICYFDTSAFVPLLIEEPSSAICQQLWRDADDVISTRIMYLEASGALAQATRCDRMTASQHTQALLALDRLWQEVNVVDVTKRLVRRAAALTFTETLRSYDALHCATAENIHEPDLLFASGDRQLLKAGANLGLNLADVNDPELGS